MYLNGIVYQRMRKIKLFVFYVRHLKSWRIEYDNRKTFRKG